MSTVLYTAVVQNAKSSFRIQANSSYPSVMDEAIGLLLIGAEPIALHLGFTCFICHHSCAD